MCFAHLILYFRHPLNRVRFTHKTKCYSFVHQMGVFCFGSLFGPSSMERIYETHPETIQSVREKKYKRNFYEFKCVKQNICQCALCVCVWFLIKCSDHEYLIKLLYFDIKFDIVCVCESVCFILCGCLCNVHHIFQWNSKFSN